MDKYQVIKKLGEGAYGVVVKCVNTQTQELVAIKKMKGQYASWDACIKMPEVQALKKLNSSPYLIKIKEMVHNKKENEVNIVFEYCDKNLFQEMQEKARKNQAFSEMEIKIIMFQALSAVAYMHSNGYMHRDIKPENFLVNTSSSNEASSENTMPLKLADFGLAKDFKRNRGGAHTEYVATRWYRAPELVLRSPTYDQGVDVFALGCIMAELYMGRPLFPGVSESDQLTRIVTILGTPSPQDWSEGHRIAQMKGIKFPTVQNTTLRQHFGSVSRFDISDEAFDLMSKMFKYNSEARITAQQSLQHEFFKDVPSSVKNVGQGLTMNQINQRRMQRNRVQPQQSNQILNTDLGTVAPSALPYEASNPPAYGNQEQKSHSRFQMKDGQLLDNNHLSSNAQSGSSFVTNQKLQPGAVAQAQASGASPMLKPSRLESETEKDKKLKIPGFNPRMSKYGQGSFRQSNLGLAAHERVAQNSDPLSSHSNLNQGAVASQPYSNYGFQTEKPQAPFQKYQPQSNGSMLDKYNHQDQFRNSESSQKKLYESNVNSSQNMKDDFFDKMMKSNPLGGGGGGASGVGAAPQNAQNNIEFGYGTLYKRQQAAAGGAYGATSSPYDQITQSQSVGLLPMPRSGSRLDHNTENNQIINGGQAINTNSPGYGGYVVNGGSKQPGRGGLGSIGVNIMSSSGMGSNMRDFSSSGAVSGANNSQPQSFQILGGGGNSSSTIPVLKPSQINIASNGQNKFSNIGQSLMSYSPDKNPQKANHLGQPSPGQDTYDPTARIGSSKPQSIQKSSFKMKFP